MKGKECVKEKRSAKSREKFASESNERVKRVRHRKGLGGVMRVLAD